MYYLPVISKREITDSTSSRLVDWKLIPPHSPHFGGLWETGVKSSKHHFKRSINGQIFTFEELSTLTAQIEAVLNSHPLCILDDSPDSSYLTPGHFLIGRSFISFPVHDFSDVPSNRLNRWQELTKILTNTWKHWSEDYLQTLQKRQKWSTDHPNLLIGDVVLI